MSGWIMHDNNHFTKVEDGYILDVHSKRFVPWHIIKDGQIIDSALYHNYSFDTGNRELQAKAAAERALTKIKNSKTP